MNLYVWDAPTVLSRCIASALAADAPDVLREQMKKNFSWKDRKDNESLESFRARAFGKLPARPRETDIEIYTMFVETWGSTALGFGGMGGSAMTPAYTVILQSAHRYLLVYWNGGFAYKLDLGDPKFDSAAFQADMNMRRTRAQSDIGHYRRGK